MFCYFLLAKRRINPLNSELNLVCDLLALLGAHPILHVSRIRVKDTDSNIIIFSSPVLYTAAYQQLVFLLAFKHIFTAVTD